MGNADSDVLIAGWASFDSNEAARCALAHKWSSAASYANRVADMMSGAGVMGGFRRDGNDGATQTVFNDDSVDVLTGSSGQDWFFANRTADNGGPLDVVTDQAANELWDDTDW